MKKIMFNDKYGLTDAVLNGQKTMTRRIIPTIELDLPRSGKVNPNRIFMEHEHGLLMMDLSDILNEHYICAAPELYQAKYQIGEVVAVAQAYKDIIGDRVFFKSSETGVSVHRSIMEREKGWSNKMFVASEFMPYHIRITDIKVERLQDISDEDCLKEGIHEWDNSFSTPRKAFAVLIEKVSGKGTWERNPWVLAYTFELERRQA